MSTPGKVRIGAVSVEVPEGVGQALADSIAERLTARLKEIEVASTRIDTLAFAMQLAFDIALQNHRMGEDRQRENAELLRALSAANDAIEAHLAKH